MQLESLPSLRDDEDALSELRASCTLEQHASELLRDAFVGILENGFGELTMRQMAILLVISDQRASVSELGNRLGIKISSVSRSCDMLGRKGIARRERNGKNVIISITPMGKAVIGRALTAITAKI